MDRRAIGGSIGRRMGGAEGKVGIALDTLNLGAGARELGGVPDYRAIAERIACGRPWIGIACTVGDPYAEGLSGFHAVLRRSGFEVRTWQPVVAGGREKRDNDVDITVAAMRLLNEPDLLELCIASGDSDFRPLAFEARRRGRLFSVASFDGSGARILRDLADRSIVLNEEFVIVRRQSTSARGVALGNL